MNVIEKEIIAASEFKPRKKYGNRQEYLRAVINAVSKLDDDAFDALSDEAAEWCNNAIEVINTTKNGELPDFDEVEVSASGDDLSDEAGDESDDPDDEEVDEDVGDDEEDEPEDEDSPDDDGEDEDPDDEADEVEDEESEAEPKPVKKKSKAEQIAPRNGKSVRSKEGKAKIAALKPKTPAHMDVALDKWECMAGSQNSKALAMFEKGATTSEVRKAVGGTYYNILKKMVERGHTLEKEGALMKLTHMDDAGKSKSKAAAKASTKKGKK